MPDVPTVHWMLGQLGVSTTDFSGDGGLGGSCYGCPFASAPQDHRGVDADPYYWRNDPSEAWFTCSLPTRDPEAPKPQWGEYSPCTQQEWVAQLLTVIPDGPAIASGYVDAGPATTAQRVQRQQPEGSVTEFQVGDRVSVEGVITYINERGTAAEVEGASGGRSDIVMADLTLVERPKRKLRVGSVWECADMRYTAVTKQHLSWVDHQGTPRITERSHLSFDSDPELWREVPVEELEAEAQG